MKKLLIWGTGNTREKFQKKYDKFFQNIMKLLPILTKIKISREKD